MNGYPCTSVDPALKQWATVKQAAIIDAINEAGSQAKAAVIIGCAKSLVGRQLESVKRKAAAQGYAPESQMVHPVPSPFAVKGVSTLYKEDGSVAAQWVKTDRQKDLYEDAIRQFVLALCEDAKGKSKPAKAPARVANDLLAVYPMGDPHFGLYSWAEETGEDFDLDEAERRTVTAVDRLVSSTPKTHTGLLLNLGDFFHADDSKNQTPASGHALDVDTRHAKVLQVGLRAMKHCIERMKRHHEQVIVWNMPGNHDPHSSFMLALCLDNFYSNDPRVSIDLSPSLFKYKRFGQCLVASHHGHGTRASDLPLLMAADMPDDWGATRYRYWLCGHIHHKTLKEHPGVYVETFNSLTGTDAWHAGKGYRAAKSMQAIIYHRDFGEVERHTCALAMLETA